MKRVLIVSHDAGGAEVLSAWCEGRDASGDEILVCVDGPAGRIFKRDWPALPRVGLEAMDAFSADDYVLTGTSLECDLERRAIARARRSRIHCVSFLEHWDLYRERFDRHGRDDLMLPDELWVGDSYARDYAISQGFPAGMIRLVDNPYFEKIRRLGKACPATSNDGLRRILYICEPFGVKLSASCKDAGAFIGEGEHLRQFLRSSRKYRSLLGGITVRPHPRDVRGQYDAILREHGEGLPVSLSGETSLIEEIMQHDTVVGVESMALVVGLALGKLVFSCIPGHAWAISLPQREIRRIASFDELFRPDLLSHAS